MYTAIEQASYRQHRQYGPSGSCRPSCSRCCLPLPAVTIGSGTDNKPTSSSIYRVSCFTGRLWISGSGGQLFNLANITRAIRSKGLTKQWRSACSVSIRLYVVYELTNVIFHSMPLYHFVTDDLPHNTQAPELYDENTAKCLQRDGGWTGENGPASSAVTKQIVGKYLSYLCAIGFLDRPHSSGGLRLPVLKVPNDQITAQKYIGGRGSQV